MPYWMQSTLAATPALLWMFAGVGLPWALVALPRRDWRDRVMVACLALAFGPALVTAWMFVLGSVQGASLLRLDWVLGGTVVIAAVGWVWVWRRRVEPQRHRYHRDQTESEGGRGSASSLRFDEKLLIGLVGIALVVRWVGVAYWPTTAYDALWVYGYEGKLYTLLGHIPTTIEYYPQFLPLQHTFLQLAVGDVDDHAARAVLPWLHLGSILAVYVMGNSLFTQRAGVFAAAIWALYPHMGEWSRYGDLEVPLTFMFTGAAAFFVLAWGKQLSVTSHQLLGEQARATGEFGKRYATIAGIFLGIGLWTKPTMGAFVWGMALVVGVRVVWTLWQGQRGRGTTSSLQVWNRVSEHIQIPLIVGLVALPLGGVWYARNVLLGHAAIIFPDGFWQTLAARSGVEFGWPLLALLVVCGWVIWKSRQSMQDKISSPTNNNAPVEPLTKGRLVIGLLLVVGGLLPSIYDSGLVGITDNRMGLLEWLALAAGGALVGVTLWRWAQARWTDEGRETVAKIGWLGLLGLPYFLTWFYSYSYHYRLSFAIVPLIIVPTAVVLARSFQFPATSFQSIQPKVVYVPYLVVIIGLSLPGMVNALYDPNAGWDWLWTDKLPDDPARYVSGNKALMRVVDGLQIYLDEHPGETLQVVAPGIKRLPFFFPLEDIHIDKIPTRLSELDGVTYFIYGTPESGGDFNTLAPGQNQVLGSLALATTDIGNTSAIMRRAWGEDDGIFKYTVYELHLENRFKQPFINGAATEDVQFGNFVRYLGYDIGGLEFWPGRKLYMHLYWQVLEPPQADYMIYIHLRDRDGNVVQAWDGPVSWSRDGNYYSTLVWEAGEIITDERLLIFDKADAPLGDDYQIVIGMYDLATDVRVPITVDDKLAGNGYALANPIQVVAVPPQ